MKEKLSNISSNSFLTPRLCAFALIILHLIVALPLAYFLNIWVDEASSLYTTERGVFFAFQNALADEKQAPLYFWILSLWRSIDGSILFARILSIIFSLLAIKFFFNLARKLFDEKTSFFITAFFAIHPYLFWASLEIRVYSLVIFLSVLWLDLFFDNFLNRADAKMPKGKDFWFILLSIAALYTNYYLGFLLVGGFFALFVLQKWREARSVFLQMFIVGAFILPLLWAIKAQFAVNTSGFQAQQTIIESLQIIWNFFLTFTLPTEIFTPEESTAISILRVWLARFLIIISIFLLLKRRQRFNKNTIAFGTITATICIFLVIAYFALGKLYVEIRHAAVLFVPLILTAGLFLNDVFAKREAEKSAFRFAHFSFFPLVLIFFTYSIYALYPNFAKRGDWAKVGEFIAQNESENQPIVVFTTFDALVLPYHYKGKNKILPDEKFFSWEMEAETGSSKSWEKQTEFIISEIPPDISEIWLLTNEKCSVKDACLPLENFVERNYTIVQEKDFYHEKVRLLRKKDQ